MRKDTDYCVKCGNPIEVEMIGKTDICGSCADELRADEDAMITQAISDGIQEMKEKDGS